ncbi:ATPase histidine kinase DNA gyrase B HSP90 domain protein [Agrilactobacillus composti DSM 18527 = JCM 14202]|uniref:histidine kinase n=1 Tax=Agrilactobacillus composti DSM 18527 = JCM 14202 TaxID=1423734 RepID=X0PRE7_9LACO|nr:sensor histidine kinase [Agrilactobacillus composti]KRM31449.1 ATPase histidine kinase DNA gyrase B HSP90 domain protein [Agrilactobacillus composti DSM 18527 = JCM 14202]GAF40402.1 histidine kinase [Agrilactobacillus composti DSM 18527 = JCM 14202]
MANKQRTWSLWLNQWPMVVGYGLALALLGGLLKLYALPTVLFWDSLRYTWLLLGLAIFGRHQVQKQQLKRLDIALKTGQVLPEDSLELVLRQYTQVFNQLQAKRLTYQRQAQQQVNAHQDYVMLWSHEIKTPLTALNLLAENDPTIDSSAVQQQVVLIQNQLDLLLNYERLANFNHDLAFKWIDLTNLVTPIIQEYAVFFVDKRLKPVLALPKLQVLTDAKWLRFMIQQVVFNAVKYANPGGTITLKWQADQLLIQDQGIGIAASDLPRVFEPGFTGSNGRQHQAATGMGLYMAQQVSHQLGLGLTITSQVGQGTQVAITFTKDQVRLGS